jgi:hypothetical protein
LSELSLIEDNKSQQRSTTQGWGGIGPDTTNINKNQQSQQKSAKVSKISPGPEAQSAKISNSQQKSACFALVRKQLAVFLKTNSGYWNIKECVTEGRRSPYKFLLQTVFYCGIYIYHSDTLLPQR